ncbi:MAG: SDR family oxidoreductase [Candidatus Hydrogenedentota bacterium]
MKGKTCIVTGANSGIGRATALGLATRGAHVIMACRDIHRSAAAQEAIKRESGSDLVDLMELDLSSMENIRSFAKAFLDKYDRLDVLLNNAAVVPSIRKVTEDGYEAQIGVNHLGHFLLTNLLLERLKSSAPSRVVTVSSVMHVQSEIDFDNLQSENGYKTMDAYKQSKLANVLFSMELARRLEGTGVTSNCLHPGVVNTGIMRDLPFVLQPLLKIAGLFMLQPSSGAETSLYVATAPELEEVTGRYFDKSKERSCSSKGRDEEVAKRLWEVSETLC